MAMTLVAPMASVGVGAKGGGRKAEGGAFWVSIGHSSGLSEGMCNFRVGNLASEAGGWGFSLIGA